jgi:hypothetical protein
MGKLNSVTILDCFYRVWKSKWDVVRSVTVGTFYASVGYNNKEHTLQVERESVLQFGVHKFSDPWSHMLHRWAVLMPILQADSTAWSAHDLSLQFARCWSIRTYKILYESDTHNVNSWWWRQRRSPKRQTPTPHRHGSSPEKTSLCTVSKKPSNMCQLKLADTNHIHTFVAHWRLACWAILTKMINVRRRHHVKRSPYWIETTTLLVDFQYKIVLKIC